MIAVIFGAKGTGKTKHLLELANKSAKTAKGSIVFIDDDNSYMYDLSSSIRFVNATEYGICTPKMLYGFLCGISAMDFDLEYLYIDGFNAITHHELKTLEIQRFKPMALLLSGYGIHLSVAYRGNGSSSPSSCPLKMVGNHSTLQGRHHTGMLYMMESGGTFKSRFPQTGQRYQPSVTIG